MLALVRQLQEQGLDIRYDSVVLRIGDSLIQRLAEVIADGDFLIAVISPDSVESGWCQRELSLAATQGINEKRVKVLPVKFRDARLPVMLGDTFYGDADRFSVETLAEMLTAAARAHLEGRGDDARREAEAVEPNEGAPAHAEIGGDVGVAQIEEVAQRAMDVFQAWERIWDGGNLRDLADPQRRLRWALDVLPDRFRSGLPLVEQLASAAGDAFFAESDLAELERDIRAELHAARTRVAQGLLVSRRWLVVEDLGRIAFGWHDAPAHVWRIQRGQETRSVAVSISGTVMESADEGLPDEVVAAKKTHGRSVLATIVGLDDPPARVSVTTAGVSLTLPE